MIAIYNYDKDGFYTGLQQDIPAQSPIPPGWTHKTPVQGARFAGGCWQKIPLEPDAPEPVPESVTVRQARQWMITHDIMPSQIDALISDIEDETDRELLRNYWEYSTEFQRSHPLLIQISELLNLVPEQLDQAFREATNL